MRTPPVARIVLATVVLLTGGLLSWRYIAARGTIDPPAAASSATASARGFLKRPDGKLPNILLLTVDTLRADHVSVEGSPFPGLTPSLTALAARGTTFLHTTAPAPATRPALAGLLTGSYVQRHRVVANSSVMPENVPVLADILKRRGYTTAAFYGNKTLNPESGFGRGFQTYTSFLRNRTSHDEDGTAMASAWLASPPRQPWFLWLHLMSPHGPYNSAPPSARAADVRDPLPDIELEPSASNYGLGPILPRYQVLRDVPPRAAEYRRRYRDEVSFVDEQVAQIVAALEANGLRESTVLIFTADHGEALGEDNYYFQHGWLANEPTVHVPLIWSQPGTIAEGHRVTATTSLVDVVATLLAGLGIAPPPIAGRSLGGALAGGDTPDAAAFVLTVYANQVTAVRYGKWKLVHTPPPPRPLPPDQWHDFYSAAESWVLHDLEQDPGEANDVSATSSRVFAELQRELVTWERRNGLHGANREIPKVDGETLENLRSLGYVN